jgi:hypothetical protein
VLHGPAKIAPRRFGGCFQAIATNIVEPAVIGTGNAAILDSAVGKRSAAMGAAILQKPHFAFSALEQHQVFAQNPYKLGRILSAYVRRDSNRMPIAAQQFSGRRTGANASEHFVFFSGQHFAFLFNSISSALVPSTILNLTSSAISQRKSRRSA